MHIFVLGGNSVRNKPWAHDLRGAIEQLADSADVHEYAHWETGEAFIDLEKELKALAPKTIANEYLFVAKSMGTVLAAKGIKEGQFAPKLCVMLGTPLSVIKKQNIPFTDWLKAASCNLLFIQNEADPLGSFDDVVDYIASSGLSGAEVVGLPGDTHDYLDLDKIKQLIAKEIEKL